MNGISRKIRLAACVLLLIGCRSIKTQYPSLAPSGVSREQVNKSFDYHDPNPDIDAGPWVERPRGFERPRATPRRVDDRWQTTQELEQRDGAPVSSTPSASNYPNSVTP